MHDILLAFALTLIAGLSTGVGSLIALLARRTDRRFLSSEPRLFRRGDDLRLYGGSCWTRRASP